MGVVKYKICDACGQKENQEKGRHWSDVISTCELRFKGHAAVQSDYTWDLCSFCAKEIFNIAQNKFFYLKTLANMDDK